MADLTYGWPLQGRVHAAVELGELRRVFAEQVRPELGDARAHALGVGRQVKRPERADLAVAGDALVGLDRHDRAVEDRDGLAAGPFVASFVQAAARRGRHRIRVIFIRE